MEYKKEPHMKISCLMATAGRYSFACSAVAQWLEQDYQDKELVILNNSDAPLSFDHPQVRVYNETHPTLGHCRNRLLELAGDATHVVSWDDDDIRMPWFLSQAAERIGDAPAFKAARSWWYDGNGMGTGKKREPCFELASNALEASILWDIEAVRRVGYRNGQGDEHAPLLAAIEVKTEELGSWAGYCYMHGLGHFTASQTLQQNDYTVAERAQDWKDRQRDYQNDGVLVPDYMTPNMWRRKLVRYVDMELRTPWMLAALGAGPAHAESMKFKLTKIMPAYTASRIFANRKIVVAPGVWDALHDGHRATLRAAKDAAGPDGVLLALVNEDDGVEHKGLDRPILTCDVRAGALSSLPFVDGVIRFPGRDDRHVIEMIRPAAIFKGHEYSGKEVRNSDIAKVIIAPDSGYVQHTSDLIAPITQPCPHTEFHANIHVVRSTDGKKFRADLSVQCSQCKQPFRFLGLPEGLSDFGANCSEDAKQARLAMRPA